MKSEDIRDYITKRVVDAFLETKEEIKGFTKRPSYIDTVKCYANYVFLDSSDIYQRCSNEPFPRQLIDICIELSLYRDGFTLTANKLNKMQKNNVIETIVNDGDDTND